MAVPSPVEVYLESGRGLVLRNKTVLSLSLQAQVSEYGVGWWVGEQLPVCVCVGGWVVCVGGWVACVGGWVACVSEQLPVCVLCVCLTFPDTR